MLARIINKIYTMVTFIILLCVFGAALIYFFAYPPQDSNAQSTAPFHPSGTLFYVDSSRLDSLRQVTSVVARKADKEQKKEHQLIEELIQDKAEADSIICELVNADQ